MSQASVCVCVCVLSEMSEGNEFKDYFRFVCMVSCSFLVSSLYDPAPLQPPLL
jgi:hypothetical protein